MQDQKNQEIRVTAKTLDRAIKEASELLNVGLDDVDYRIISKTNGGFFSFIGKKVEIAAKKKGQEGGELFSYNKQSNADKNLSNASEVEELPQEEVEDLKEDLREFCAGICSYLTGEEAEVHAEINDNRLILDVEDEFLASQILKNSKLAEAMEHILRKKPRHLKRELPFRVFVDVKGVRREREENLVDLARDLSEKVDENKRPIVLNYKSSYDRKIIHMALDKDERVYTKSIGSGPNRKLMILPIKEGKEAGEKRNAYPQS